MIPKSGYLGYSSGSKKKNDYNSFKVYDDGLEVLINLIPDIFPNLKPIFYNNPILISCYPSFLGIVKSMPVIESYLRQDPFSRGLQLALNEDKPAIILGQPLSTAEMLLRHKIEFDAFPKNLLVALGGYYCPSTLENFIKNLVKHNSSECYVLHGYGVAEIGAGCFLGMRNDMDISYKISVPTIQIHIENNSNKLFLSIDKHTWIDTGDYCHMYKDSSGNLEYRIKNDQSRLPTAVKNELESWSDHNWLQRTGYMSFSNDNFIFQLRHKAKPSSRTNEELEYYDYSSRFGHSWLEKPFWSTVD